MKESGLREVITTAKKRIVTYGNYSRSPGSFYFNGFGLFLQNNGKFTEDNLSPFRLDAIAKYFHRKGGFIGNGQVKGLDFHLNYKRYGELWLGKKTGC